MGQDFLDTHYSYSCAGLVRGLEHPDPRRHRLPLRVHALRNQIFDYLFILMVYCMSKKYWPMLYSKLLNELSQDFLDRQQTKHSFWHCLVRHLLLCFRFWKLKVTEWNINEDYNVDHIIDSNNLFFSLCRLYKWSFIKSFRDLYFCNFTLFRQ